jgi:D-sedoheptulose 7-phosphate isomerase
MSERTSFAPANEVRSVAQRTEANARFFAAEAERLAQLCEAMSERFARGGRLLAVGATPAARSDVHHVAVEFVHPVIVGKRALPALALWPRDVELLAEPDDMVIAFDAEGREAVGAARARGCLVIDLDPGERDPFVAQELVETAYHVLWELVHVFFEHRATNAPDPGASAFLYPFLGDKTGGGAAVVEDVRRSVLMKAEEIGALREQTLGEGREGLARAAAALRERFDRGGKLLACGNGGSATDAMDAVADLRTPPAARWPARRALDLTDDAAILTAIANDVGVEPMFARQVIAYGREGDALLAFSTSGGSANILAALAEARRRRLLTVALVGYDGGQIAADGLADHVIVSRSQHIPRIQEAQASAWHVLRELVEEER